MKKKSCFILAILMIMVQLVSAFAVLPAMAETTKSYDIVGTKDEITVDGKANEAIWNSVKSSSAFVHTGGNAIEGFTASFKAVWTPNAEDTSKMDVYIFVTSTEYTVQNSWANNIRFQIETADASHRFWTGQQQLGNVNTGSADRTTTVGEASVPFKLYAVNNIGTSKTATYEFCYTMPKSDTIKFDILLNACESASNKNESGYSWVSMTGTAIASANLGGEGKILPIPEYDFDRITESMTIDGKANESFWGSASSVEFVNDTTNDRAVSFKAGWSPCDGGENMKVYFLISVKGYKEYNYLNSVQVQLEDENGSQRIWSGAGYNINSLHENTRKDVPVIDYTNNNNVAYQAAGVRVLNGTSVYEYAFTMKKTETIRFDILASFYGGAIYSFAGIEAVGASVTPTGIGNVVDYKFNALNIVTTPGASIRVDTANKEKSGIRFETKVDAAVVVALKDAGATITTGTLVLPTATLMNNGIADSDFTIAKLEEAQLRSGIDYYNIINVGNEWVEGMDGTWFGTVFDVKNLTRQFSAVGYVTVELDGETTTLYGGYVSDNSRSVSEVATVLLKDEPRGNEGDWNAAQEEILETFARAGGITYSLNSSTQGVKILGERYLASDDQLNCDWTGSGMEMDVVHQGGNITFTASASANCYFRAYVDGNEWKDSDGSVYYTVQKENTAIVLKDVPAGEHRIKLVKVTGYTIARAQLHDVTFAGTIKETAPADNDLYIEFIGDSISCGWGTIGNHEGAYTDQDGTLAYPMLVSEALNADYSVMALSGQGLICGINVVDAYQYASTLRSKASAYGFERKADIVVVNIGTNDYRVREDQNITAEQFYQTYLSYLQTIREKNGEDCVILCLYNCMNDTFGESIQAAVTAFGGAANNAHCIKMDKLTGGGAGHPNVAEQAVHAEKLVEFIDGLSAQ